ncbi:DUF3786 domain-containing protein [Desulfomonile tiedjei]|uniref:DUF3786 domain-containing protein n=1 Tax=Desulfomonile tiedjei (strain ATCC 49306 / DSM 6799 / DCB-1) TaxID=706587 RepID=I4CEQ3_DESTA|nr:DUF3786 domain-containing protein [Desulfomonile tiedjei]AFM28044.1 hypothetical protein Desti_5459 [Desulfomonile tiedjei DSM 6799]
MKEESESLYFDEIYRDYLDKIARIDLNKVSEGLGIVVIGEDAIMPLFGMEHRVSARGIVNQDGRRPSHSVSVVLCKYLLMCPETEPLDSNLVSYRDFKDSAPFAEGFRANAEANISRAFSGRIGKLEQACQQLMARPVQEDFPGQLKMRLDALPKVPILLLFNDEDEEFPAQCSLLFERRAEKYLDMECLAISGWILAEWLKQRL